MLMFVRMRSGALKRIAGLVILFATSASTLEAQTPPGQASTLESIRPGMTIWVTDTGGREEMGRVVELPGDVLITTDGERTQRRRTIDIVRVRARHSDSLLNGALIGAGAAVASGLLLCNATEPWENCRDDVGPMIRIGALGAGSGIGVDALSRGRRTIYEAPGSIRGYVAPVVGPDRVGATLSLRY